VLLEKPDVGSKGSVLVEGSQALQTIAVQQDLDMGPAGTVRVTYHIRTDSAFCLE
jgi:hypothetical protein